MFIAICAETLHMKPEEVLGSDFVLLSSVLREYNYILHERNKLSYGEDEEVEKQESAKEFVQVVDFESGKLKKVERVKRI